MPPFAKSPRRTPSQESGGLNWPKSSLVKEMNTKTRNTKKTAARLIPASQPQPERMDSNFLTAFVTQLPGTRVRVVRLHG